MRSRRIAEIKSLQRCYISAYAGLYSSIRKLPTPPHGLHRGGSRGDPADDLRRLHQQLFQEDHKKHSLRGALRAFRLAMQRRLCLHIVPGGPLFKDVPARPGGLAPYRHHCRGLPHPGLPRQKRERRLTLLRPPRPTRQKPKSYFTKNVKRFSDLPKNVKHLAFLSKFPKNFSDFPSFSEPRIILYFGSDENIGIHRGPHEYRRCNYLAAEPSDSPRASDFRFCL